MVPCMWGNICSPEYGIPPAVGEVGDVVGITEWYPPCEEIFPHLSMEFLRLLERLVMLESQP
jgi:hypothetical protein